MAAVVTLARTADFEAADIEALSLLAYTAGYNVVAEGWVPNIADDFQAENYTPIGEVINLYLKGTNHDGLATYDAALRKILRKGRQYAETPERYGLWLRAQLSGETSARQALITDIGMGRANVMSQLTNSRYFVSDYPLSLQRMPLWEATATTTHTASSVPMAGGTSAISGVTGTDPARIARLRVNYQEVWFGFKSSRNCALANFVSPWEIESGSPIDADTSVVTVANASPGGSNNAMQCTFATSAAMITRASLAGSQISPTHYTDLRGTYQLILAAKCDAGTTANVRAAVGLPSSLSYQYGGITGVSETSWELCPLGQFSFPAGGKTPAYYDSTSDVSAWTTILIQAERTSGSGKLYMDCIIPIPVDEGFGHVKTVAGISMANATATIFCSPSGVIAGTQESTGGAGEDGAPDLSGTAPATFSLPVGASKIVVAAPYASYTGTVDIEINAIARWRMLRGNSA